MNYKLPSLKVIAAAVFFAWTNKAELLRAISVPTLVLVVIWGVWLYLSDGLPPFLSWILFLAYGLSFSLFAVTCHRLILVDLADRYKPLNAAPGYRELKFLVWVTVIYAIKWILENITMIFAQYVSGGVFVESGVGIAAWIEPILSIPALYVFARLSLSFPAAAIDRNSGPRWSWIRTQGNGWRIFVVVGLFPWLAGMAFRFMWREEATVLEQVVLSILAYIGLSIEIIALSFTYKELAKQYAAGGQPISGELKPTPTGASPDSFHELAQGGKGDKLYLAVKVITGFSIVYLFIGTFASYFVDCQSELVSQATSPGGAYRAELLNRTCKDDKEQGLVLEIGNTSSPRKIERYVISKAVSNEVDMVWTSDKRLLVRHAKSLDWAVVPAMFDDVQIVFE
jgi:hypothetical protein